MIKEALYHSVSDIAHIKRNAAVQLVIATIAFVLLMCVFPAGKVQSHTYSKQQAYNTSAADELVGDAFTSNDKKLQTVWFAQEHLYSVKLYMLCSVPDKSSRSSYVLFRIYDQSFSCIYEEECCIGDIEDRGYLKATPDMDVGRDSVYYYEVIIPEDCEAEFVLPVADVSALNQSENGVLYIDGIYNDTVALIADFDYSAKLSVFGILLRYVVILAAAAAVYAAAAAALYWYDVRFSQNSEAYLHFARIAASVLASGFALFLFIFSVVLNRFGGGIADRLFFTVAIVVGLLWLMLAIWLRERCSAVRQRTRLSAGRKLSLIWRNYIQTVCFGLLFYALCQYVNADREYYHNTNTRWMLIFLAIAFLMMYTERQFLNKLSGVWLLAALIGSLIYCRGFEQGTNERHLAALACGVTAAWGLLLVNVIIRLVEMLLDRKQRGKMLAALKTKPQPIKIIYALLWVAFSVFMYVYRFEKVWVFTATLPFVTMFFLRLTPASKSRLLKNLTNGILLSFGLVSLFCFVHRPYHYWMYYRYGGMFHTVSCTGMYLAVVFGAAAAKLFGKLKAGKNMLILCPLECFITAAAAGYIILTMSRTAYLTAIVTALLTALLAAFAFHKAPAAAAKELGVLLLLVLLNFPLVFSAVRMLPAVINDPVRYDLEYQDRGFMIYRGDPIDSDKYMTVPRFFSTLFGRFLTQADADGEDEEVYYDGGGTYLAYTGNGLAGLESRRASSDAEDTEAEGVQTDVSNGRFEIFMEYFKAITLSGHEKMGLVNEQGDEEYGHAHNSYLQIAYNFGMIAGVVFLIICAVSIWSAVRLALTQGEKFGIYLVPSALIIVFGMLSLTEWAFHPCIPAGFCFLIVQPLLIKR